MLDPDILSPEHSGVGADTKGQGRIVVLHPDLAVEIRETGVTVPNGLCWGPDERVLYIADSRERTILACDYDIESGRVSGERVFARADDGGMPDGMCMDAEGCLWNARHGSGRLVRYRPDGAVARIVPLPVFRPASLAFGGDRLETLYVATASQGLSARELEREPLAGMVLAVDVGVRGLPPAMFSG